MRPPVLTSGRIDAMLSGMAEICMAAVEDAGVRLKAASDDEAFRRGNRTLQRAARNLRQTIALKQRFDRDRLRSAVERRREAEVEAKAAGEDLRTRVHKHFERTLWDEYEDDDAQQIFDEIDQHLDELDLKDRLLARPVEELIARLSRQIEGTAPKKGALTEPAPKAKASKPPAAPPPPAAKAEPAPAPEPTPPDPPPPPVEAAPAPEPWPEPYIPPWERAPPGRIFPGGSSW